jgi:hypothetical protein
MDLEFMSLNHIFFRGYFKIILNLKDIKLILKEFIMEIFKIILEMVKDNIVGIMENIILVTGKIIKNMEMVDGKNQ